MNGIKLYLTYDIYYCTPERGKKSFIWLRNLPMHGFSNSYWFRPIKFGYFFVDH